ncbi:MAG: amino acid permease [Coriobacteriia bacterium]|nr:amino acid permease [Coriobacteriia bacterium]
MPQAESRHKDKATLLPYLSPAAAWALALGTSVGWGSLVVTTNTYLIKAGPLGSVLGITIGGIIMLVVARNYHYMTNCVPEAGGAYAYARETFGYDHGFLAAWFIALTYLAMLWANATSLPLFARIFFGSGLQVGHLYSLFGYDVYLGEVLLAIAVIAIVSLLCMRYKKGIAAALVALVGIFCAGITLCFAAALFGVDIPLEPLYVPNGSELSQIMLIACISPWAFIGFESISHASEEFAFPQKKTFSILALAVISAMVLYVFITALSITAFPSGYSNWFEYVSDLGNLSGIEALPPFYAAYQYLGDGGVGVLMASLLALIATSLIGNILALSRLVYSLGRDQVIPRVFAQLNDRNIPARAILLIMGISCIIPLFGRVAVGWVVDVTTIGATIIYGFVSACAWKTASFRGDTAEKRTGLIGLIVVVVFGLYFLVPNLFTTSSIEPESFFLFVVWAVLGFVVFRLVLSRDAGERFGNSIIVWAGLLSLVLFVSLVWMSQSNMDATNTAMESIQQHYAAAGLDDGQDDFAMEQLQYIREANTRGIVVVVGLFALSIGVLVSSYAALSRRARRSEEELGTVRQLASTDPLTGVKSKHAYASQEMALDEQIAREESGNFAIAVCDVNGLKHVNDTFGHKAGDEYIRQASTLICQVFQHSPVFRIGGDEFVVVLRGSDYDNRLILMDELNKQVLENIARDKVSVAAGLAEFTPGQDTSLQPVFERADQRMYQRKQELKSMGARTR